jgi:hypothetical protein
MSGYVSPHGLDTQTRRAREHDAALQRLARLKKAVLRARVAQHAQSTRRVATESSLQKALHAGRTGHPGALGPAGHADPARWAYATLPEDHGLLTPRAHYLTHLCALVNAGTLPTSALSPVDWAELELDPLTGALTVAREEI